MASASSPAEPQYGGCSRFELELEVRPVAVTLSIPLSLLTPSRFVQCLANPDYLNYLAVTGWYDKPEFVAYLGYLQYFKEPKYAKYLHYPGPTLRALELLQQTQFRLDIVKPNVKEFMKLTVLENAVPSKKD